MSILNGSKKINILVLISIIVVLGFTFAFGGLKLKALWDKKEPLQIIQPNPTTPKTTENQKPFVKIRPVVASKNGTTYHLLDCPGAKTIEEKNKIYFKDEASAQSAGYEPAQNCIGLIPPHE